MAGGGGCRDERRGSSASEVGTVDGTAKKKKKKKKKNNKNSPSKIQGLKLVVFVPGYVHQFCLPFVKLNFPFSCPLHYFFQDHCLEFQPGCVDFLRTNTY